MKWANALYHELEVRERRSLASCRTLTRAGQYLTSLLLAVIYRRLFVGEKKMFFFRTRDRKVCGKSGRVFASPVWWIALRRIAGAVVVVGSSSERRDRRRLRRPGRAERIARRWPRRHRRLTLTEQTPLTQHADRFLANLNSRSRSLYAIACPSVCRLSVCLTVMFVRPTQAVQIFGNISTALGTLATH